jgi:sulfopropanediol 3-dehydrogenase
VQDFVPATVQGLLTDIAARADAAVREMSAKFDGWARTDLRLTDAESRACLSELPARAGRHPLRAGAGAEPRP